MAHAGGVEPPLADLESAVPPLNDAHVKKKLMAAGPAPAGPVPDDVRTITNVWPLRLAVSSRHLRHEEIVKPYFRIFPGGYAGETRLGVACRNAIGR